MFISRVIAGRTVRVSVRVDYMSELLQVAIEAGFDWVYFASHSYVRLSVIPDGELINSLSLSLSPPPLSLSYKYFFQLAHKTAILVYIRFLM